MGRAGAAVRNARWRAYAVAACGVTTIALLAAGCATRQTTQRPVATSGQVPTADTRAAATPIGCTFNGRQLLGDLGAVFNVSCPSGCAGQAPLWGTTVYTADSSICGAGIHAGVIPA